MPASPRWSRRPAHSNWGDFGPDDQLGRLNLLTPEKVRQGVAEVRAGLTFCLSMPLDYPGGDYHGLGRRPPALRPHVRGETVKFNLRAHACRPDVFSDESVRIFTHYSTHWDALSHAGSMFDADGDGVEEMRYYNGYAPQSGHAPTFDDLLADKPFDGAPFLGIDNAARACVQGRAVMVDLFGAFGADRRLVGYDDLMRACELTGAEVEPGDMLCIHTGQASAILDAGLAPDMEALENGFCHLDGCDERLLRWIEDAGVVAIAADNFAVEAVPPRLVEDGMAYERIHELCLFKLGILLGELWHLGELNRWLGANRRTRFLLSAPPLRLPGAVGSPVTPIATV